jgi:hypothetical protein
MDHNILVCCGGIILFGSVGLKMNRIESIWTQLDKNWFNLKFDSSST